MQGKKQKILFFLSLVVLLFAIIMASYGFPKIVKKQIQKNIQIEEGSAMFEKWKKIPIPLHFKVYLFNVSNPDEVSEGAKPQLTEIGPYVYDEYREKTILSYGANDTVEYMLKKTFIFNQELSGALTEDDQITVINLSYLAAILKVQEMVPGMVGMVNEALELFFPNLTDAFTRARVGDFLFDGIFLNCAGENMALKLVCGQLRQRNPPTMRATEDGNGFYFSMFSHLNRTETGPYRIIRGRDNIEDLGNIVAYKNQSVMKMWGNQYCGQLNGSDSSIFPPIDENNVPEKLYTFEPEVCRSMFASLVDKRSIFNMSAYYYEVDRMALASKSAEPNNKCFCKNNWSANHDGCLIMGILDLTPCQDVPVISSLPHFYLASEELLAYFDGGIKPDKEKHGTYVYIEPITGVVLSGSRRLQFNIELRNIPQAPQLEKVPTGLFPLLWVDEGATIPESIQQELRSSHVLLGYIEAIRWVLLVFALLFAAWMVFCVARSGLLPWPRRHHSVSFIMQPPSNGFNGSGKT